ncbi:MAG: carbohydrate kinase family protein [Candidatus Alkanophagales archaeon]
MFDVIVVGHATVDTNVLPWGTVENVVGGAPTYAGMMLATLRKSVGVVSKVGADFDVSFYERRGIDTRGIRTEGGRTTRFRNVYDAEGDRRQVCEHVAPRITPEDVPKAYEDARSFYISPVINEVDVKLVKRVKRRGNVVMLDPQGLFRRIGEGGKVEVAPRGRGHEELAAFLEHVDVVKVGKDEVSAFGMGVKEVLLFLARAGVEVAIVTLGGGGSVFLAEDRIERVGSLSVDVKDPTGAGDVFGAAFLAKYLETHDVPTSVRFATVAAGLKIRFEGPTGFPSEGEILEELGRWACGCGRRL